MVNQQVETLRAVLPQPKPRPPRRSTDRTKMMVRLPEDLREFVAEQAIVCRMSQNAWLIELLTRVRDRFDAMADAGGSDREE